MVGAFIPIELRSLLLQQQKSAELRLQTSVMLNMPIFTSAKDLKYYIDSGIMKL